ncbi:tRNA (adenosine(37)-N6)-dimethylallyltransferase MiaA [Sulfurovum sp. XGS-02]|uniref:tRNA (adenosine(37)-N6)-dimethylallyltransferase MiaA n=1 Tax=Sulfurovum sp. XGS-02 TaxID=2925411 RepID=UPI00205B0C8F|nr:tRNA (adenosine(37)-N6)-dimethylallyltransferase MiaA [Sulfurovum sp. XGS-02]UPT77363.1 tRNA (adenosine(37)-N6)-dimethylallyltransferase MiaA [Sulfurovum sp. XGS-02]
MQDTNTFEQLALIGPTASGKTALSIKIAQHMNAYILSLDSLSIFKEIDIVSAKPTLKERAGIEHFGMDYLYPDESFDVTTFIRLYHEVHSRCLEDGKNLVIVGGTSFYLKMLIEGISELPSISNETKTKTSRYLQDLQKSHAWLYSLDSLYMSNIEPNDPYRIEKALDIYLETGLTPTQYFKQFPPRPTVTEPLPIYQIEIEREKLRERIALRTNIMINDGLIDEICMLEKKYTRSPNCMKSIGIKETLAYLDGIYDKKMLSEKITTNTARLAKRQTTFNNSQFNNVIKGSVKELEKILL